MKKNVILYNEQERCGVLYKENVCYSYTGMAHGVTAVISIQPVHLHGVKHQIQAVLKWMLAELTGL